MRGEQINYLEQIFSSKFIMLPLALKTNKSVETGILNEKKGGVMWMEANCLVTANIYQKHSGEKN